MRHSVLLTLVLMLLGCGHNPLHAQERSTVQTEFLRFHSSVADPRTLDRLHGPILSDDFAIRGAQSCAAASCHGGPRPGVGKRDARRGASYTIWLEDDPHSRSWRTMCSEKSSEIFRNLNIITPAGDIIDEAGFDNCLACHNSTKRFSETRIDPTPPTGSQPCTCESNECGPDSSVHSASVVNGFMREGIGCSGCHGPSGDWIASHTRRDFLSLYSTDQGFIANADLYARARMCASCHVGDQDRDMNHDIIAAGHPALHYEFATYHNRQPKHWREPGQSDRFVFEPRLWVAGQVASADASLSLLRSRALKQNSVSVWPEFSAYDCASCHHQLGFDNARMFDNSIRRGKASYSRWNDSGLRWFIEQRIAIGIANEGDFSVLEALEQLRDLMNSSPTPDPNKVASHAQFARESLSKWFESSVRYDETIDAARLAELVVGAAGKTETFETWESAAQFYLAATAARAVWPGGISGPARDPANRLQVGLRFPRDLDVSRFAKKTRGVTVSRYDARQLGIELASWLGDVQPEPGQPIEPELEIDEPARKKLLDRLEERWKVENQKLIDEARQRAKKSEGSEKPIKPKETLDSLEKLQQELEKSRREADDVTDGKSSDNQD